MSIDPPSRISGEPRLRFGADIHSHILPGIDDGAVDMAASVLMAAVAVRNGTTLMTASPHRFHGGKEIRPYAIRTLVAQVRSAIAAQRWGGRFDLRAGQEIPLTLGTGDELQAGVVMTLGDTGAYALVEPPFERLPPWSAAALANIVRAGFTPVFAHPERNAEIQKFPEAVRELVDAGALVQLTAMSVTGHNGPRALFAANWILDNGLATVVSSDCHSATWRPPTLRAAFHAVRERLGAETAQRLCSDAPRAIVTGSALPQSL